MANPQKENGYTAIANEILERLYAIPLSGSEYKIILCILRKTYGWRKKSDYISLSQLVEEVRLSKKQICEAVNKLCAKQIIIKNKFKFRTSEYYFNKDFELWITQDRTIGSYEKVNHNLRKSKRSSYEKVNKVVTKTKHTKENKEIKETITKESKNKFLKDLERFKTNFGGI